MKKMLSMILICTSLFVLAACRKTSDIPDLSPVPSGQNNPGISEKGSTHMTKVLCEGLEIDADIPSFDSASLPIYQASPVSVSQDDIINLFLKEDDREIATHTKDEYDPKGFRITMKRGQEIYHQSGQLSYWSETSAKDQEIFDVLWRYAQSHPQEGTHVLSFMSPQKAIEQGVELVNKLGLIGTPDIRSGKIVGLSGEEIMKWQGELLKDEHYKEWVDIGKTMELKDLTSEDDAYLLSFNFTYQNVPIFNRDNEPSIVSASDDFAPTSTKACMLFTAKGLRYFSLAGGVSTNGAASQPQAIISSEDVLNKLVEKYEDTVQFGTQRITEVWLEYIPRSDSGVQEPDTALNLTPYWCFRLASLDDVSGEPYGYDSAARFNAITGKDLAYGG